MRGEVLEIKSDKKRYALLPVVVAVILPLAVKTYSVLFPQEQPIEYVLGEAEIFVNGIWIPLKAGMDVSNAIIRIRSGAELKVGDRIIRAREGDVELSISETGKLHVEKGKITMTVGNAEEKGGIVLSEQREEVFHDEEVQISHRADEKADAEDTERETHGEYAERAVPKILRLTIKDAEEQNGVKYLRTKKAKIEVEAENLERIAVGGVIYRFKENKLEVVMYLREGENKLEFIGLDDSGRAVLREVELVYVDTKPPVVKIPKEIKFE